VERTKVVRVLLAAGWVAILAVAAVALVVAVQGARFKRGVAREARRLWAEGGASTADRPAPETLPAPVRRYLEVSGATRRAPVRAVRLRHGGTFRIASERWDPIRGEQYFSADPPGFVWWGRVRMAPGLWVEARDRSVGGEGQMLVRIAGTFTLGDIRGAEMDQGALLRLLAELVWLPTALLDAGHVAWAPVDDASARATLRVGGREVEALFRFGPDGLPAGVEARRTRQDAGGRSRLLPWTGAYSDWREVEGLRVPFRCEVSWIVDGRPEPYARWQLEQLEVDRAEPY
jgi:hypothetical protein